MKAIKLLLLFMLCCITINCNDNDDNATTANSFTPTPVNYSIKYRGEMGGFNYYPNSPNTETTKISTNTDYTNYITSLQQYPITSHDEVYNFNPLPDFSSKDVLIINYKCNGDLGKKILVNSIIENENDITVKYVIQYSEWILTAPGKPFILIEIPKSTKPVVFIDETN